MRNVNIVSILLAILLSTILSKAIANESNVEILSEEATMDYLHQKNIIPSEKYYQLIDKGFNPEHTLIKTTYSRTANILLAQLKASSPVITSLGGPAAPEEGDEQEYRYERAEGNYGYRYREIYCYSSASGWEQILYSRAIIEPTPNSLGENERE